MKALIILSLTILYGCKVNFGDAIKKISNAQGFAQQQFTPGQLTGIVLTCMVCLWLGGVIYIQIQEQNERRKA